jgi:addiction module HigA family antidote
MRAKSSEYLATPSPRMPPVHPGELLKKEVLPALGLTVTEAARRLRVSRQMLHGILAGTRSISPEMALRIGKFVGNGPGLWIRMQEEYDLWHAESKLAAELRRIQTAKRAA